MEPRLASSVLVTALMRRAESQGGFAAVLAKGDSTAGAVIVILAERGRKLRIMERILRADGCYAWQESASEAAENEEEFQRFLRKRQKFDPDIWVLELDIASVERFADEMNDLG
jgi:hypothetical protein